MCLQGHKEMHWKALEVVIQVLLVVQLQKQAHCRGYLCFKSYDDCAGCWRLFSFLEEKWLLNPSCLQSWQLKNHFQQALLPSSTVVGSVTSAQVNMWVFVLLSLTFWSPRLFKLRHEMPIPQMKWCSVPGEITASSLCPLVVFLDPCSIPILKQDGF